MTDRKPLSRETTAAQAQHYLDPQTGGVVPPIQPSTTFARDADYQLIDPAHGYSRDQSPSYAVPEALLAEFEGAQDAMLFASGMAAGAAVFQALETGARVVAPRVMYWGLRHLLNDLAARWGLDVAYFDTADPDSLEKTIAAAPTRLVWIETPCNPTWDVIEIRRAAELARDAGALLAVDSTVATPVLTRPIELGADIVMHSATKYLNGHGDVVAGALATADDGELWQRIRDVRGHGGAVLGPFEAWLLQRGMRTMFLRVPRSCASALAVARFLERHAAVASVSYPGLESHPGHEIATRQMEGGYGGMLSFTVHGDAAAALAVAGRCQVFIRATSLGGVESLIEHRKTIEGEDSPIAANLLRLSVGIESVDDLIADLDRALTALT